MCVCRVEFGGGWVDREKSLNEFYVFQQVSASPGKRLQAAALGNREEMSSWFWFQRHTSPRVSCLWGLCVCEHQLQVRFLENHSRKGSCFLSFLYWLCFYFGLLIAVFSVLWIKMTVVVFSFQSVVSKANNPFYRKAEAYMIEHYAATTNKIVLL